MTKPEDPVKFALDDLTFVLKKGLRLDNGFREDVQLVVERVHALETQNAQLRKLVEAAYREAAQHADDLDVDLAWDYSNVKSDMEDLT